MNNSLFLSIFYLAFASGGHVNIDIMTSNRKKAACIPRNYTTTTTYSSSSRYIVALLACVLASNGGHSYFLVFGGRRFPDMRQWVHDLPLKALLVLPVLGVEVGRPMTAPAELVRAWCVGRWGAPLTPGWPAKGCPPWGWGKWGNPMPLAILMFNMLRAWN